MNQNTPTNKTVSIVIKDTALSGISFKESIDFALVSAAFDQKINLIFIDDGVYNLIQSQNYNHLNDKNHLDILKGLEFYEVENIIAENESLISLCIDDEDIIKQCEILSVSEIKALYSKSDIVVNL